MKVKRTDLSKEQYDDSVNQRIVLDMNTPCAVSSDINASHELKQKVPTFQLIKSGITINDCLYNDSDEFKSIAKSLGMTIYNAPLALLYLTRAGADYEVGTLDRKIITLDELSDDAISSVKISSVNNQLENIAKQIDIAELSYELAARIWKGQYLSGVIRIVASKAIAMHLEKDMEFAIKDMINGLETIPIGNMVVYGKLPESESLSLTKKYSQVLQSIKDYYDYTEREIRRFCKTEQVKDRLLDIQDYLPLSVSEIPTSAILPEVTRRKIAPKLRAFYEFYESTMRTRKHLKQNIDSALSGGIKDYNTLMDYINIKLLANLPTLRTNTKREKAHSRNIQKLERKIKDISDICEYVRSFNYPHILPILLAYEKQGYITLSGAVKKKLPSLDEIFVNKGIKFDDLQYLGQVCPLGLAEKWDTWKIKYDPIISTAAKYYKTNGNLVRIEFDNIGNVDIEFDKALSELLLNKNEVRDLIEKIEALNPQLVTSDPMLLRHYAQGHIQPTIKKLNGEQQVSLIYAEQPEEILRDLYCPLRKGLKLITS